MYEQSDMKLVGQSKTTLFILNMSTCVTLYLHSFIPSNCMVRVKQVLITPLVCLYRC